MEQASVVENDVTAGATRARFGVIAFTVSLAFVIYLDRVCISTLAKDISRDLHLEQWQMAYVFSAFQLAYALLEIPTAWWADRRGTRKVLTRIVLWWSALTIATAGALSYNMLLAIRFLFGVGEAGALPCVASTCSRWIPASERGRAQSFFFAGSHISGAVTPMLVILISHYLPWRGVFMLFGLTGFIWSSAWWMWYRDDPAKHPAVNAQELEKITRERRPAGSHLAGWEYWSKLLTHRNTWPLCLMYVGNCYAYYFVITWMPTYLEERYGLTKTMLGIYAGLPLLLSVAGDFLGGYTTDHLSKRFGLRIGRCGLGAVGYTVAAAAMILAATSTNSILAIAGLSVAVAMVMFTVSAAWAICIDIGGQHTGVVGALMNSFGNTGAIFAPIITIYAKNHWGGWHAPLLLIASLFVVGTICWCLIDPRERVFD